MQNTLAQFNNHPCARLFRRIMLGAVVMAAVAALVVLGDNGMEGQLQLDEVEDPDTHCQKQWNNLPDAPEENLAAPEAVPVAFRIRPLTNAVPLDTNEVGRATNGGPKGGIWQLPQPSTCSASGSCTNDNVSVSFTFHWCCDPGYSCFVRVGGAWMNLAQWLQFNAGGCLIKVGCKRA